MNCKRFTYFTVTNPAALTRPNEFRMVHSYRPASWLVIFLMNKLPLGANRCLADGTIELPSFRHFTSGVGSPWPWHGNSIVVPSCATISNGSNRKRGLCDIFSPTHTKLPKHRSWPNSISRPQQSVIILLTHPMWDTEFEFRHSYSHYRRWWPEPGFPLWIYCSHWYRCDCLLHVSPSISHALWSNGIRGNIHVRQRCSSQYSQCPQKTLHFLRRLMFRIRPERDSLQPDRRTLCDRLLPPISSCHFDLLRMKKCFRYASHWFHWPTLPRLPLHFKSLAVNCSTDRPRRAWGDPQIIVALTCLAINPFTNSCIAQSHFTLFLSTRSDRRLCSSSNAFDGMCTISLKRSSLQMHNFDVNSITR